jgi:menaquinone-dependent protoporphyrinogen oxidase
MARILVLYGTTDGHTAKVAQAIGDTLRALGASVNVADAAATQARADEYSAVIVTASVHAGGYQRAVVRWVNANVAALRSRPTAFVSVCLGVLQNDPKVQRDLLAIIDRFKTATGWEPRTTKIVAGALLYRRYNWLKRWMMKRIVTKAGGDTDTSRDYEYTDWQDVRVFAGRFARTAGDLPAGAENSAA